MTHFAFRAGLPPLRHPHLYRPARALPRISDSTGHHAPARGQSVLPCPILPLQLGTGRSAWETGLITLPYAIGSLITSGLGGQLAPKAGRLVLVAGSLTVALSQGVM